MLRHGKYERASQKFRRLIRSYPLLLDYHRYYAALALYRSKRFAEAERFAAAVHKESGAAIDASLLRADALVALHRLDEAANIWRAYLRKQPNGHRTDDAHNHIAQALLAQAATAEAPSKRALLTAAARHFRQLLVHAPLSPLLAKTTRRLEAVAGQLPQAEDLSRLRTGERYTQSLEYFRRMRNVAAEKGFAWVMNRADVSTDMACQACYYRAKSIFKQRQRARAAPIFEKCANLCQQAGNAQLRIKSLYNFGRGLYRLREYQRAAQQFSAIETEFPSHSYADDARIRAAEAYAELQQWDDVTKMLAEIPVRYPRGDMADEALWRLAWRAYQKGQHKTALRYLQRSTDLGRARAYYAEGRALYWMARIYRRLNQRGRAYKLYERCIREYALSYYALLSFNRLREHRSRRYGRLVKELIRPIGRRKGRWTVQPSPATRSPAFKRGVELARLGFAASAGRELARAGLSTTRTTETSQLWLAAAVYDRAELWHLSHQVPRSRDRRFRREYPLGPNYWKWRISYPRAFGPFVRRGARAAKIPRLLPFAIMREESGFSARIESYANAIGLMQLILPTARAAGARRGVHVDRAALQDPATNIRLGTHYLGFLYRAFGRRLPLTIAGYNGGHGAVYRWLKRFSGSLLDEFVEQIPYDQTRRYTKRVLATLFAYSALYAPNTQQRIPRIRSRRLPRVRRAPSFAPSP